MPLWLGRACSTSAPEGGVGSTHFIALALFPCGAGAVSYPAQIRAEVEAITAHRMGGNKKQASWWGGMGMRICRRVRGDSRALFLSSLRWPASKEDIKCPPSLPASG